MKTRIILLPFVLLVILTSGYCQNEFEQWDENYRLIKLEEVIEKELIYSDSINYLNNIPKTYARIDKYRFEAQFTGKKRKIKPEVLNSMKFVFNLFIGNPEQIEGLVKSELQFTVNGKEYWMPIQKQLEKPFKKEIKKNSKAILYCLFMNEQNYKGELFNTCFISEFRKIK